MSPKLSEEILDTIAPFYRPYIRLLWRDLDFGLYKTKVDIEQLRPTGNELSHQFSLNIPYSGTSLKWEVIFEPSCPSNAPDFRFDDETFLLNIDVDCLSKLAPSWVNWDPIDPRSLSKVISELMTLYRAHQVKLLSEDENSRAYFEYTALLGDSIVDESDIEVYVGHGRIVQLLIRLNVNTEHLPELFQDSVEQNPGGEFGLLLVRYPNPSGADLKMSPLIIKAIGSITLPAIHQAGVLIDYVPMVTTVVNKRIHEAIKTERLKRNLLSQLVVKFQGALLEHGPKQASFLFEVDDFYAIFHIDIASYNYDRHPQLTLRSVYHKLHGKPRTKALHNCPYNSLEDYLKRQIAIFKTECSDNDTISCDD